MSNTLRPHGLQHTRLPCPSLSSQSPCTLHVTFSLRCPLFTTGNLTGDMPGCPPSETAFTRSWLSGYLSGPPATLSWESLSHFFKWGLILCQGRGCQGKCVESSRHVGILSPSRKINITVTPHPPAPPGNLLGAGDTPLLNAQLFAQGGDGTHRVSTWSPARGRSSVCPESCLATQCNQVTLSTAQDQRA